MTETTKQRWLFGIGAVVSLGAGALAVSEIEPSRRAGAVVLLVVSAGPGFGLMWLRELYLRRTGKRPLDKPPRVWMNTLIFASVGIAMILQALAGPLVLAGMFGAFAGVSAGLWVYIGKDLERLDKA